LTAGLSPVIGGISNDGLEILAAGAVSGVAAVVAGGQFALGFGRGAIQYLMNDIEHERPDADGYVTLDEANQWRKNGNKEPLTVDADKLTVKRTEEWEFKTEGRYKGQYLAGGRATGKDYVVHGQVTFVKDLHGNISMTPGAYDFEMHSIPNGSSVYDRYKTAFRNYGTIAGRVYAGEGQTFKIYYRGTPNGVE